MELGLHIANFTWNGGPPESGSDAAAGWPASAEDAGIARLTVMDHFWQIGPVGPPEDAMLEAYTALGFLAGETERVALHTLVTGVVYREPGLLAKLVTTLDVLSGGRAGLGIGAAWYEEEALGLGFAFPPTARAVRAAGGGPADLLADVERERRALRGQALPARAHAQLAAGLSRPHPYLMIGGCGERKTLRLVAQYADACNIFARPDAAAQARRPARALRAGGPRLRRDREDDDHLLDPAATHDDLLGHAARGARPRLHRLLHLLQDPEPLATVELLASVVPEIAAW